MSLCGWATVVFIAVSVIAAASGAKAKGKPRGARRRQPAQAAPDLVPVAPQDAAGLQPLLLDGNGFVEVVGESKYQAAIEQVVEGAEAGDGLPVEAALVLEPDNPYDPDAVAVQVCGMIVGYLSRQDAKAYGLFLRLLWRQDVVGTCRAFVTGGRKRGNKRGVYGVTLRLGSPADVVNALDAGGQRARAAAGDKPPESA
jgi:hypothetical protein